jgi:environmental stress-induced protein Ves
MSNKPFGTLIRHSQQIPGSWSGGATLAIYAEPGDSLPTPGGARIWLGTATIERAADFSYFPGRMRVHVPITGQGIQLRFQAPAETVTLPTFAQHRFDGARPVHAELIDGPIAAFNLIAQPDVEAMIEVLRLEQDVVSLERASSPAYPPQATELQVVYVIAGALALATDAGQDVTLHAADAFVFQPAPRPGGQAAGITLRRLEAPTTLIHAALRRTPSV